MAYKNPPKRKSITEYGGIVPYLNATASDHGGVTGYKFIEWSELGLTNPNIAKKMHVSVSAIKNWKKLYAAEKPHAES